MDPKGNDMTIRVCPMRDAICPHDMDCPHVDDGYLCKEGWDAPIGPKGNDMADELRRMRDDGWIIEWEPATSFIGARHPKGGRQSIARVDGKYAAEVANALLARLSRPSTAEAVAWRYRRTPRSEWWVVRIKPTAEELNGAECEPLYSHPSPQGGAEPVFAFAWSLFDNGALNERRLTFTGDDPFEIAVNGGEGRFVSVAVPLYTHPIGETGGPADAVSEAEVEAALATWPKPWEEYNLAKALRRALEAAQRARK